MRMNVISAITIVSLFIAADLGCLTIGMSPATADGGRPESRESPTKGYYILAGVKEGDGFNDAVLALKDFRGGEVIRFDPLHLDTLKTVLKSNDIRYAAIVMRPEDIHANFTRSFLMMSTELDDDPFSDFSYGYITGSTPQEAVNFVNNIKKAENEGVAERPLDTAGWAAVSNWESEVVTSGYQYSYFGKLDPSSYSDLRLEVNDTGAGRDFFSENKGYLEDQKLLYVGFNGDPHMLWLFDGGNFDPNPPLWDYDPANIEDPGHARMGLTSENLSNIDMFPAVAMNGACHSGVMKTALVQGDIAATFGEPNDVSRWYTMSDGFSFAASMLRNNITGYFAPVGANHGSDADDDRYHAFLYNEPLGDIHKRSVDDVVMGFLGNRPNLVLFEEGGPDFPEVKKSGTYDPKNWSDDLTMMLSGKANRIYYGDPLYDPFKNDHNSALNLTAVRFDRVNGATLDINISFDKPAMMSFPIWDKLHSEGYKIYVPVGLPDEYRDVKDLQVQSTSGKYSRAIKVLERFDGRTIAHLEVDVPSDYSSMFWNRLQFNITLRASRPLKFGVDILGPDLTGAILPGERVVYNLSLKNTGETTDNLAITISNPKDIPAGWLSNISYDGRSMAPGTERSVKFSVSAPSKALAGEKVIFKLSASSGGSNAVSDNLTVNMTVAVVRDVDLTCSVCSATTLPRDAVGYPLVIKNSGNDKETVRVSVMDPVPEGWDVTIAFDGMSMSVGESRKATVSVSPPSDALNGTTATISVRAVSSSDPDVTAQISLTTTVGPVFMAELETNVTEQRVRPGESANFQFKLMNKGNAVDEYELKTSDVPSGWTATVGFDQGALEAGGARSGNLTVTPSEGAEAGAALTLEMFASSKTDGCETAPLSFATYVLPVPGILIVQDLGVSYPAETATGDEAVFRFIVRNTGNGADNISLTAVTSNGWAVRFTEWVQGTRLFPGEDVSMNVLVRVPSDATAGEIGMVTVTGTSDSDPNVTASCSGSTIVAERHQFDLMLERDNEVSEAGSIIVSNLTVVNNGNGDWLFTISVTGDGASAVTFSESGFMLPKGASKNVKVTIAAGLPIGDHTFKIVANDGNVTRTVELRVSILAGMVDEKDASGGANDIDFQTWSFLIVLFCLVLTIMFVVIIKMRMENGRTVLRTRPEGPKKVDDLTDIRLGSELGPPVASEETEFIELSDEQNDADGER